MERESRFCGRVSVGVYMVLLRVAFQQQEPGLKNMQEI